ncbi:MAG: RNA polymerase sigma factor [Spirochaetales bacterium]|nr:RNA polymerase sigma factor [Spirochaetales bacterium]
MSKYIVSNVQDFLGLYKELFPKIYNYVLRNVYHQETAEDITATVFEKALRHIKKHHKTIENFQAWIYRIATNEMISSYNKKRLKNVLSIDDENLALENLIKDDKRDPSHYEDFMDLKAAIKKLKPNEALLIELFFFEKQSYEELEKVFDEKQVTLRSRLHRTLKKLEQILKGEAGGDAA